MGEPTRASFQKIIDVFKKYGMGHGTSFVDIGSGFGLCVFHAAQ